MTEGYNENWNTTDKRFVAFLDILGFKDLVMRSSHSEIYDLLSRLSKQQESIDKIQSDREFQIKYKYSGLYIVSFSDSIVLFSKNDSPENFDFFTFSVFWLFSKAIEFAIPMKGAISFGEISVNKSKQIYFGQPIIDAYLLEEEVNYMGIVAHHTIDQYFAEKNPQGTYVKNYIEIDTPLKCGNITHLNLNWFDQLKIEGDKEKTIKVLVDLISKFKTIVSGNPRRYIDNTLDVIKILYDK